jgi:hypothetical protein
MGARPQRGAGSRRSAAGGAACSRCGTPVIRQLVGQHAGLTVVVDAEPITREQAAVLVEPDRLAWCLAALHSGGSELRWRCRHNCGHGVVIEHRCPTGTAQYGRRPEGALW